MLDHGTLDRTTWRQGTTPGIMVKNLTEIRKEGYKYTGIGQNYRGLAKISLTTKICTFRRGCDTRPE
jgi:hypothetical protein